MAEIIGVRFKKGGKIYYFRPNDEDLEVGCYVVVETVRGTECGEMVMDRREISDAGLNREIKTIIRKATQADLDRIAENKKKAKRAFDICSQKIKAHGLEMNLLEVEYTFDNSKIVFNFSAEGRVDFRELVKDLASVFRARIELRQIGVRDEAKMLGGLGVCGRPFCCKQFMGDFQSVSIKMAKEQGLSLNPVKISGTCGRLMCCLKHEQDTYEALMSVMPPVGATVTTPEGEGVVVDRELVAGRVKVRLNGSNDAPPKSFKMTELKKWSGGQGNMSTEELTDLFGGSSKKTDEADEWAFAEEFERTDDAVEAEQEQHTRKPKGNKGSRRDGESRDGGSAGGQRRGGQGNRRPNNRKDSSRGGKGERFEAYEEEEAPRRKNNNFRGKNGKGKPYYNRKNNPSSGKGGKGNKPESAE